jgi:uncharacterized protein (DUF1800 family)
MDLPAAHAFVRFGLGRRGVEPMPDDPAAWLRGQLRQPAPPAAPYPTTADGLLALRADRRNRPPPGESRARAVFRASAAAFLDQALTTATPFHERLVWFWANHFTVSLRRGEVAALAGAFVAEAIRPHVTGRFQDMLLAVMRHPAMLLYLDNAGSIGPDSPAGRASGRGLNENLARECLELHTVTPAAGYTQADVTAFARVLTGWSIEVATDPAGFRYRPRAHEPGEHTVMGRVFPAGEAGGIAALGFLASHPATHRALAVKLARHFVADDPPPDAIRRIEAVLRDSGGDLGEAAASVIGLDGAWQPGTKLRTPQELVVASVRALDLPEDQRPNLVAVLGGLGQPLFAAPAPNGWADRQADWASPEAMMRRIDWVTGFSGRLGTREPMAIAEACLGPLLRPATEQAMRHAGSRRDACSLLLSSPEFQRR